MAELATNSSSIEGFSFGNLTYQKSNDCLRKVKYGMKSKRQLFHSYIGDVAETQQYFLKFRIMFITSYKILVLDPSIVMSPTKQHPECPSPIPLAEMIGSDCRTAKKSHSSKICA